MEPVIPFACDYDRGMPSFAKIESSKDIAGLMKLIHGFFCKHHANQEEMWAITNSINALLYYYYSKPEILNDVHHQ